jgi:octaprenyl-diphosphate synthase
MLYDARPTDTTPKSEVEHAHRQVHDALDEVGATLDRVVEAAGPARPAMHHLIGTRGKMLRPRLVLLSSAIVCGEPRFCPELAAAAELIHSASLLHDDVIDEGDVRRGKPAARVAHCNGASVLAGDHCLTDAFDLIRAVDPGETLGEALATVRSLVDGELLQLATKGQLTLDEAHYRRVCSLKTASLFVWSARAGARWAGADETATVAFGEFAENLGIAFQIRDDLLDFVGDDRFGKRLLDDLREGRSTLPVILAAKSNPGLVELFEELQTAEEEDLEALVGRIARMVRETGAPKIVADEVTQRIDTALERLGSFPASPYRTLLEQNVGMLVSDG